MNKRKLNLSFQIVLIFCILIIAQKYSFSQKHDLPNVKWKKYVNYEQGYTFKYPSDLVLEDNKFKFPEEYIWCIYH